MALVPHQPKRPAMREDVVASTIDLARQLVRTPSRAGLDDYAAVFGVLHGWMIEQGISCHLLKANGGGPIALVAEVTRPTGPTYVLNATVDTAGFGDEQAWSVSPTFADVRDGWLFGRGSADSKSGVAIFCHVAKTLLRERERLRGSLKLIFDADEHTGEFTGFRSAIDHHAGSPIAGVMLGYPGFNKIGVGARGYERAIVAVHGRAAHSGSSSDPGCNAIPATARLVQRLTEITLPSTTLPGFPLPPRLSVTMIDGGSGFSEIPDVCRLHVDVRLTPAFGRDDARALLEQTVHTVRHELPDTPAIDIEWHGGWPAYRLPPTSLVAGALADAVTAVLGRPIDQAVVGPSNVGNFLFQQGIEATCGFGVAYRRAHATDECIDVTTIQPVYDAYLRAVRRLLEPI